MCSYLMSSGLPGQEFLTGFLQVTSDHQYGVVKGDQGIESQQEKSRLRDTTKTTKVCGQLLLLLQIKIIYMLRNCFALNHIYLFISFCCNIKFIFVCGFVSLYALYIYIFYSKIRQLDTVNIYFFFILEDQPKLGLLFFLLT